MLEFSFETLKFAGEFYFCMNIEGADMKNDGNIFKSVPEEEISPV